MWAALFEGDTKTWSVYDPSGTFDQSRALLRIDQRVEVGQLTSLEVGNLYLVAVSRDATLQGFALGEGINYILWSSP